MHGPDVARELGITRLVVPPSPGILCAEGLLSSDLRADFVNPVLTELDQNVLPTLEGARETIREQAQAWFEDEKVAKPNRKIEWKLDMCYRGQNYELSLPVSDEPIGESSRIELMTRFHQAHETAYGFSSPQEVIELVNIKARVIGILDKPELALLENKGKGAPLGRRPVQFNDERWQDSAIWHRNTLSPGQRLEGPVVIEQLGATIPVFPGDVCTVQPDGSLHIEMSSL